MSTQTLYVKIDSQFKIEILYDATDIVKQLNTVHANTGNVVDEITRKAKVSNLVKYKALKPC